MAPEYAKRLTTEDEVADGWTSRVYWITMLYGYVPQTRRTQGTIISSVSFFTIGRLRVLHPYHTHHLGPLLGDQSSERRWIYTHNVNLRSSAYPTIGPYPWARTTVLGMSTFVAEVIWSMSCAFLLSALTKQRLTLIPLCYGNCSYPPHQHSQTTLFASFPLWTFCTTKVSESFRIS